MNKLLKLSLIAALAMTAAACDDKKKDDSLKCDETFASVCLSGTVQQICDDGVLTNIDCEAGQVCDTAQGKCVAASSNCTNDAKQCAAGIPQLCVDGSWVAQDACAENFSCFLGNCIEDGDDDCNDGDKQCAAGIPQLCVDGAWAAQAACEEGLICANGNCIEDSDDKCTSDDQCEGICSEDGECIDAECIDNAGQCGAGGIPELCVSGRWVAQDACGWGQVCESETGECQTVSSEKTCDAADKCVGAVAHHCLDGEIVVWDCIEDIFGSDGTCIIADSDKKAWCAVKEPYDDCDYDYEFLGFWDNYMCYWEEGFVNYAGCAVSGGDLYLIDAYTDSLCLEDSSGSLRLFCNGTSPKTQDCDEGCISNGWATMCIDGPCVDGSQRCNVFGAPELCVDEVWVAQAECASGQICDKGTCLTVPVVGDPCNEATFAEQCLGNSAYYCWGGKIGRDNCAAYGDACVMIEGGIAWCAELDPWGACKYDGQTILYSWACSGPDLEFDSCYEVDGQMYVIEDRIANSVCQGNNRTYCSGTTATSQGCGSLTCSFDGLDATCVSGCTEGAKRCGDTGIPELCVSNAWVAQAACAEGEICAAGGGCRPITVGDSCNASTFVESCTDGALLYCGSSGTIVRLNCAAYSLACVIDDTGWGDCYEPCTSAGGTKTECVDWYGLGWYFDTYEFTCTSFGGGLYYLVTDDWECPGTCNAAGTDCM
ncbi:MAG: hypothetical protein FWC40_05300 [Proteobacteria bacterium]|nr:hypothetical protein [Pseudomonadota bacterium]